MAGAVSAGMLFNFPQAKADKHTVDRLPGGSPEHWYDVRRFGARGDGKTNDASAIQKAIDACSANGGGVVLLHNGTFRSGAIILKDHVELHLTSTAVLLGSSDIHDFHEDHQFNHGEPVRSFVHADSCRHIAITGSGTIDGQGHLFESGGSYAVRPFLIQLRSCQDVRIENVLLHNSAVWACWLLQCERVVVDQVRIDNPISPNRDGIDIDGCKEVRISNCHITTEDDSLAFKVSERGHPCRDVVITNCILSSQCAAIRFGPDAADDIENVTISNCVIRDTRLNGIKIQEAMGAAIRNITFSNIVMDNVRGPVSIRVAGWQLNPGDSAPFEINDSRWESGTLQNILFNNIQATMPADNICISLTGTSKTRPRQITFSNLDFTFAGGGTARQGSRRHVPDLDRHYPEMYIFGELPAYGMYIHHASGIRMENVKFRLADRDLRPALVCDDVDQLDLSGFQVAGDRDAESAIRLQNCQEVFIEGSRTLNETGTFLRVEGAESKAVFLTGNLLHGAKNIVETTTEVDRSEIRLLNNFQRQ